MKSLPATATPLMSARSWIKSPARLATLIVVVVGIPLAGLGWLGHRVLQQQSDLDSERLQTQLANSATLFARDIDRVLAQWDTLAVAALDGATPMVPAGLSVLVLDAQGLVGARGLQLPYYPIRQNRTDDYRAVFSAAEAAEFQTRDFVTAASLYAGLAGNPDRQIAAKALLGAFRMLLRLGRHREAVADLDRLASLTDATVGGAPAVLVAHRLRLNVFEQSGDSTGAARMRSTR
jgi:hypothetical protein